VLRRKKKGQGRECSGELFPPIVCTVNNIDYVRVSFLLNSIKANFTPHPFLRFSIYSFQDFIGEITHGTLYSLRLGTSLAFPNKVGQ